jgi:hypothetical protein
MTQPPGTDALATRWAASGAMALTGAPQRPLGPPAGLVPALDAMHGRFPDIDLLGLLGERAALAGLHRQGSTSCGGSCRLLRAADGWIAVSLPRVDDIEAIPAWLELAAGPPAGDVEMVWELVAREIAGRSRDTVLDRARLVQLPVAGLDETIQAPPVHEVPVGSGAPREATGLLVVDLTSLWAGPLCGHLLARAGARVVKVESTNRPDGARRGPRAFFDLLNGGKESVALDFRRSDDVRVLRWLLKQADVVLEASRPRALAQLGIDPAEMVGDEGPHTWVSITGYGRAGPDAERVAFGDDAAAAGGLVAWDGDQPVFCADAIADPLAGMVAADACLRALEQGQRGVLEVAMAAVAGLFTGPTLPAPLGVTVAPPRARPVTTVAADLGADTAAVLAELGIHR